MFIQLDKTGFVNKGAELMLWSVIDRLKKEPNFESKIVFGKGPATPEQIRSAGMYQIFKFQRYKLPLDEIMPQKRLSFFGLVRKENIQVLFDVGGFQFGDQWIKSYSVKDNNNLKEYYAQYKRNGAKIIFLPQAFGPFNETLSLARIKIVYEYADLMYARDNVSYNSLISLFGKSDKIQLAPDFTSLLKTDITLSLFNRVKGAICIIPNAKMITHGTKVDSSKYLQFITQLAKYYLDEGEKVVFLNHEGQGDLSLINSIQKFLNKDIDVIDGLDAKQVKAAIGHTKLLISSRFHGVVSGLNQQVPTFCTSWSHKYQELMKTYNCESNILNISAEWNLTKAQLEKYKGLVPSDYKIEELNQQVNNMWNTIIDFVKK